MFVGREAELDTLDKCYKMNNFQFPVIYGRRRVGKSTLIKEFCKNKKTIYFVAIQSSAKENLDILSNQILLTLAPESPKNPFISFRAAIDYIFECAKTERIVFAIDEYPYLAQSDPSVSSILQAAIDKHQAESMLFLILCGSSMSFMENQVLGYESPLYGRRTSQLKLLPFNYLESAVMLSQYLNEEKIILHSITGGIPEYLSRIDCSLSVKENVCNLLFNPGGRLFEEPSNLLKQELKIPETYNAIIAAIAGGSNKINTISTKVGIETSQCSKMLSSLISLGLVRKEIPVTEIHSKKSIYILNDWMFIFWYRFVQPELSRITAGFGNIVCDEVFSHELNSHVGRSFEECAVQYMWYLLKENALPVSFKKIGRWWGNNPKLKCEEEVDIIAFADNEAIFCECKWRNQKTGEDTLDDLIRKSKLFPEFQVIHYILFSKSGFTEKLMERSTSDKNISLVNIDDMFLALHS
ncbi:MAG: ATP-binding protein [Oscillospiraceae bacterium]|nr:ATP-binding protein [Oscillospiraceae bacterium]